MPYVTATVTKLCFVGSNASFSFMLLFTQPIKLRGIPLSCVYVLLHYLPNMSAFNRHMQQNSYYRNLREPFKIRCHAIATQSTPTIEKSAHKAKEWTWVNCKFINAWHQISERDFCTVWVSYRRSLEELNQYIVIKLLDVGFSRKSWFLVPIFRGESACLPLLQKPSMIGNAVFVVTRSCTGIPYISASQPFLRCSKYKQYANSFGDPPYQTTFHTTTF